MSWIERSIEDRLARAARNGELDTPELAGRPIPDLDRPRRPGWWAEQFVQRERSRDRRGDALVEVARIRAAFWHEPDETALSRSVTKANTWIATVNERLIPTDRLPEFDHAEIRDRWRNLRR